MATVLLSPVFLFFAGLSWASLGPITTHLTYTNFFPLEVSNVQRSNGEMSDTNSLRSKKIESEISFKVRMC